VTQLPRNDRHLNLRLPQDLYDKALAAATAEQRPLSSWVRKLVHRELADRLSAQMDAEDDALTPNELQAFTEAGPATVDPPWVYRDQPPRGRQPLQRDAVEPRFKKGGKK
jgi:hypothetical protein